MSFNAPQASAPDIASRKVRYFLDLIVGPGTASFTLPAGTQGTISAISVVWNTTSTFEVTLTINAITVFAAQISGSPTFVIGTEPFYISDLPVFEDDVFEIGATGPVDPTSFSNAYVTVWGSLYGSDL